MNDDIVMLTCDGNGDVTETDEDREIAETFRGMGVVMPGSTLTIRNCTIVFASEDKDDA